MFTNIYVTFFTVPMAATFNRRTVNLHMMMKMIFPAPPDHPPSCMRKGVKKFADRLLDHWWLGSGYAVPVLRSFVASHRVVHFVPRSRRNARASSRAAGVPFTSHRPLGHPRRPLSDRRHFRAGWPRISESTSSSSTNASRLQSI